MLVPATWSSPFSLIVRKKSWIICDYSFIPRSLLLSSSYDNNKKNVSYFILNCDVKLELTLNQDEVKLCSVEGTFADDYEKPNQLFKHEDCNLYFKNIWEILRHKKSFFLIVQLYLRRKERKKSIRVWKSIK